jgi:aryl sulfotransferase
VSSIVWLASYPKSGNTWLRAFLSNFVRDSCAPADINSLEGWGISSDRRGADDVLGVECSDLTPDEVDLWRPNIYRDLAARSEETPFVKTHEAYTLNSRGEPLFPADITRAVIYLVRNPLDVSLSFSHHLGRPLDHVIQRMGDEKMELAEGGGALHSQLRQKLLSWSLHVLSWIEQSTLPVHLMKYEDICLDPVEAFKGAVKFLGLEHDTERIRRAVSFSSFETLRDQELRHGFKEKLGQSEQFFRKGQVGQWHEELTDLQVNQLIMDHGAVMNRLGYLHDRITETA